MNVAGIMLLGMWMQAGDLNSTGGVKWLIIFVGLVALAMVTQAIVVIVMAVTAAKARKQVLGIVEDLREKVTPLIANTHEMVRDASPKVKVITENLAHTSHLVRAKAAEWDQTMGEANQKTRAQVERVDGMVSSVLDTASDAGRMLQNAVRIPAREFSGMMSGLKAGLDVLLGRKKSNGSAPEAPSAPSAPEEQEPASRW